MKTLESLQMHYQELHDRAGLGGAAIPKDDAEGHSGFYNPETAQWDWFAWDVGKAQYVKTGSTAFIA